MNENTHEAGLFLNYVYHALGQMGMDRAAIFASVNLPDEPPDPLVRRDNSTQARFWHAAEDITGDSDIGLHVGRYLPVFRGHIFEYLFLSSATFEEGLRAVIRYGVLFTNTLNLNLHIEEGAAILSGFSHPVRHYLECFLPSIVNFLRFVTDDDFQPAEIRLEYPIGADASEYLSILGAPVSMGASQGAILFDAALLKRPSRSANSQLFVQVEALAAQNAVAIGRVSIINQIESELNDLLKSGEVSLSIVAQRLNRNPRTLRAELAAVGTNFNQVLARYRERLARRLLSRTTHSLDQIVYLTGFSEPSAFARAFKRWTGERPTDYRIRKQALSKS
ncbi:AraC family transcriptional regulator [Oleiphilus messinensis]|uniref:AraC family transcriptional regulator n=1 Tax=Oleiphilus messinensis TaxID=141451 RepID=A0A1Y0I2U0_9GAMM|nr:AraC family transcriptional regulator [Oleiphilus messinensis]ARU54731.1 AraC family transcriptional regulator [Oleiphilus messinensis]